MEVGELVFVHEYYPPDHDERYGPTHKLTLFFDCDLVAGTTPALPETPNPNQVGVEWLPLETLVEQPLLPDLGERWNTIADGTPTQRYSTDG